MFGYKDKLGKQIRNSEYMYIYIIHFGLVYNLLSYPHSLLAIPDSLFPTPNSVFGTWTGGLNSQTPIGGAHPQSESENSARPSGTLGSEIQIGSWDQGVRSW